MAHVVELEEVGDQVHDPRILEVPGLLICRILLGIPELRQLHLVNVENPAQVPRQVIFEQVY